MGENRMIIRLQDYGMSNIVGDEKMAEQSRFETGRGHKGALLTLLVIAFAVIAFVLIICVMDVEAAGPVHNVNTGEDFASIKAAIDSTNTTNGHTITVAPGIYAERFTVNKVLTLLGADRATTILNGTGGNCVSITANWVNMSGFNVTYSRNAVAITSST